ncbi:MAG TPA: ParB/RepB/Spo0J family partition protein [Candidatus Sulfomarinibacteraceae bacterium]|nr:ParB/RepB/Spo0J family partition protein [Candidatus Sulfomarinibacteraceae bacterium]
MSKRRGLGRGLGALIPQGDDADEQREGGGLRSVALEAIVPNPHQPRSHMDEDALDELAASIEEHGLIQPLIVNDNGDGRYTLIAGERRWRAAQRAGLEQAPVLVKEASPQDMLELALIENIQRADLNPLEEAAAYRQLIDEFGLTQAQVAKRVGKSRPAVANTVRLLELPERVQEAVVNGEISGGHARALLGLPTEEMRVNTMRTVIRKGYSVRQTEALVRKLTSAARPRSREKQRTPPEVVALESQFQQSLGTRVSIQKGSKGGRVVIHFYSDEELHAIYEAIVRD